MKASRIRFVLLMTLFACLSGTRVLADTLLPPPERKELWCGSHHYCAVMDPRLRLTTVYKVDGTTRKKLWMMPGWFRVAFLADDGEHLVIGHEGGNLLPLTVENSDILAYFVRKGEVVATATLADLVENKSSLRRTASHYHWGEYLGIDEDCRFRVQTVEGKKLWFEVQTGKRVRSAGTEATP
jgi:hypothetical protein